MIRIVTVWCIMLLVSGCGGVSSPDSSEIYDNAPVIFVDESEEIITPTLDTEVNTIYDNEIISQPDIEL